MEFDKTRCSYSWKSGQKCAQTLDRVTFYLCKYWHCAAVSSQISFTFTEIVYHPFNRIESLLPPLCASAGACTKAKTTIYQTTAQYLRKPQ